MSAENARAINRTVLDTMFATLLPDLDSREARVLLLAIGLQESRLTHRVQITDSGANGPARGLWQFERGGGVNGVLTHRVSQPYAVSVCEARNVTPGPRYVWQRLADDDLLAAAFARLLLWTDPHRLPRVGDDETAWKYYLRNWRPGAYDRGTDTQRNKLRNKWLRNYSIASEAIDAVVPA